MREARVAKLDVDDLAIAVRGFLKAQKDWTIAPDQKVHINFVIDDGQLLGADVEIGEVGEVDRPDVIVGDGDVELAKVDEGGGKVGGCTCTDHVNIDCPRHGIKE